MAEQLKQKLWLVGMAADQCLCFTQHLQRHPGSVGGLAPSLTAGKVIIVILLYFPNIAVIILCGGQQLYQYYHQMM